MDGEALKPEAFLTTATAAAGSLVTIARSPPSYTKVTETTVSFRIALPKSIYYYQR